MRNKDKNHISGQIIPEAFITLKEVSQAAGISQIKTIERLILDYGKLLLKEKTTAITEPIIKVVDKPKAAPKPKAELPKPVKQLAKEPTLAEMLKASLNNK